MFWDEHTDNRHTVGCYSLSEGGHQPTSSHTAMRQSVFVLLALTAPVAHSFSAIGVGRRPTLLPAVHHPPQAIAIALPLRSAEPPIEVLYDGQCMVRRHI